ncbi:MAG TPA: hypothetical protein VHF92_06495 [Geodermatophilus sp.]|nr:hypothetical protein [Geodermatophilus sp.]
MTSALDTDLPARTHHLPAAVLVAVATALLVVLPEQYGDRGRLAAVAVLQAGLVAAWVLATGVRGLAGSVAVGLAAAAGADVLLVLPERPELGALLAVPGLGFLAAVLHQMLRRPPRREVVPSLAGVVLLVCGVCALAVLLLLEPSADGDRPADSALLVVGVALVVGHLVDLVLPRPQVAAEVPRGVPGLLLAVVAAVVVAVVQHGETDLVDTLAALTYGGVLGTVAALVGLAASYVVAEGTRHRWAMPVVQAVLPIAACAPVAFSLALQPAF